MAIPIFENKEDYILITVMERNITVSTRVSKDSIEKYQRGETQNDPVAMAISCISQELEKSAKQNEV